MNRRLITTAGVVALLITGGFGAVHGALDLEAVVVAVVSGDEIDVVITQSSAADVVAGREIVRVKYLGVAAPSRFEPLYMEAFDLNWNLVASSEIHLQLDGPRWDDEGRLLAYVFLDPSGFGMVNAVLLAVGLARIDVDLFPEAIHAAWMIDAAAVAESHGRGIWANADASAHPED